MLWKEKLDEYVRLYRRWHKGLLLGVPHLRGQRYGAVLSQKTLMMYYMILTTKLCVYVFHQGEYNMDLSLSYV